MLKALKAYFRFKISEKRTWIVRDDGSCIAMPILRKSTPDENPKMTVASWFNLSTNGKPSLFSDSESLQNIYEKIISRTNSSQSMAQFSQQEGAMMRAFYHTKIRDICGALEYSLMVEYDAHIFLHKYFLKYGILDHDTKHVM